MKPIIFREYDIRGNYGTDLTDESAKRIGLAFGAEVKALNGRCVAVGYDGRLSSPALRDNLIQGLRLSGCDVIDIGLGPTPLLYYASYHLDTFAAIMITGSHNEGTVNGFKLMMDKKPFCGQQIQGLYARIQKQDLPQQDLGSLSYRDVKDAYLEFLQMDYFAHYTSQSDLKIAWDPGNGAAGEIVAKLLPHLPGTHVLINQEIDGTFPNHHPDPTVPENLKELMDVVREQNCDFGIAFDGDGDRIGAVTSCGEILYGEHLLEIFAKEVLMDHPHTSIVADVKTSTRFFKAVESFGGKPVMWRTGHSLIKAKMRELESPLGGEMSGHIFFADRYYGFDDAIYAAVRLIGICNRDQLNLKTWYESLPTQHATPEMRIDCPDKLGLMAKLIAQLREAQTPFIDTDGIRFEDSRGWWLLRASNTQEIIVARAEATTPEYLTSMVDGLITSLRKAGYEGPLSLEKYI